MSKAAIRILAFLAWVYLLASIIATIWVWSNYGTIEGGLYYTYTESNPIGFAIAIGILVQGICAWSFFLVIVSIADNLTEINNNTLELKTHASVIKTKLNTSLFNIEKHSPSEAAARPASMFGGSQEPESFRICPECTRKNPKSATHCQNCGTPLL